MGDYIHDDDILKCPKCQSEMQLCTEKGAIIWICPIHGKDWRILNAEQCVVEIGK